MTKPSTILISGGHLTPALATIERLSLHQHNLIFVGRKVTDTHRSPAKEKLEVQDLGVSFIPFDAPKFHRHSLLTSIQELGKLAPGLIRAHSIFRRLQPDCFLSFGGYLALPLAVAAKLSTVPIITHEQTSKLGLSNYLISKLAHTVALSWKAKRDDSKFVLTGNPVRSAFFVDHPPPSWLSLSKKPLIFVTAGNQGSRDINHYLSQNLDLLSRNYRLVIQTGTARQEHDYQILLKTKTKLSPRQQSRVILIKTWIKAGHMAWLLKNSQLVVSRSGANTVTELLVSRSQAILIPLNSEQLQNAQILRRTNQSVIVNQDDLNSLFFQISTSLSAPRPKLTARTRKLINIHQQAAQNLSQLVLDLLRNINAKA